MSRYDDNKPCNGCGGTCEDKTECPARTRVCNKCGKKGHYAVVCRYKDKQDESDEEEERKSIGTVVLQTAIGNSKEKEAAISTTIGEEEHTVRWRLDTGADVNVIAENDLKMFKKVKKEAASIKLYGPSGDKLKCTGKVQMSFKYNDIEHKDYAYIIKRAPKSLLGLDALKNLKVVRDSGRIMDCSSHYPTSKQQFKWGRGDGG